MNSYVWVIIVTFNSHHQSKHFIISAAGEHNMPCEQLVQTHSNGPEVDSSVI